MEYIVRGYELRAALSSLGHHYLDDYDQHNDEQIAYGSSNG